MQTKPFSTDGMQQQLMLFLCRCISRVHYHIPLPLLQSHLQMPYKEQNSHKNMLSFISLRILRGTCGGGMIMVPRKKIDLINMHCFTMLDRSHLAKNKPLELMESFKRRKRTVQWPYNWIIIIALAIMHHYYWQTVNQPVNCMNYLPFKAHTTMHFLTWNSRHLQNISMVNRISPNFHIDSVQKANEPVNDALKYKKETT